jgi:D-alanyl-lipoteichoic acid acyltransferase DltB (MBOAT superfamily)
VKPRWYPEYLVLSSSTYFVFLAAVFFLYWPLSRFRAAAMALLLLANYLFLARWDLYCLALIPAAGAIDYSIGIGLERFQSAPLRKLLVTLSILVNVFLIVFFKYMPWAIEGWRWTLMISLSFYAFQALTYTLDLYRRDATATRSLLAHLTAVSFFPTMLAGPITRVSSLIDQMEKRKRLEAPDGSRALFLIGSGLIKKLLIADYLALNLVNRVFDFPNLYTGGEVLVAVYAYAFQLYFDFSGYTDIATGSALLLGIKLPVNFNAPYSAENVADFWRRWHISLSNWLRDYLFYSLPGKRTKVGPYVSLFVTMVIGGLWHGPSWNFVLWGALHGGGLVVVRLWQSKFGAAKATGFWRYMNIFLTFHYVTFAWIFFRSPTFELASAVLGRISSLTFAFANVTLPLWIILGIAIMAHYVPRKVYDFSVNLWVRSPFYAQAAALAGLVIGIQYVGQSGAAPFIYQKF